MGQSLCLSARRQITVAIVVGSLLGGCAFVPLAETAVKIFFPPTPDHPATETAVFATALSSLHIQLTESAAAMPPTPTPAPTATVIPSPTIQIFPTIDPNGSGRIFPVPGVGSGQPSANSAQADWGYWNNQAGGLSGPSSSAPETYWRYGPQDWGRIPGYEDCANGREQSPVNLPDLASLARPSASIRLHYVPAHLKLISSETSFFADIPAGSNLNLDNAPYELVQITFHGPSEHRIQGKGYDVEVQLVHRNASAQQVIISILLRRGAQNNGLAPLFDNIPPPPYNWRDVEGFNPALLLTNSRAVYLYAGSLTTPPCSEGVQWIVFAEPGEISDEQINTFRHYYGSNARPLQPLNNRPVIASIIGFD